MKLRGSQNLTSHLLQTFKKNYFFRKKIALLGDFNSNLKHYDLDKDVSYFLDLMYSNTLQPQITTPSRITSNQQPLLTTYL